MAEPDLEQSFENPKTVAELSELYLGNILYAMERAAMSMDEEGKREEAAFYRGIARSLASARGQQKEAKPTL